MRKNYVAVDKEQFQISSFGEEVRIIEDGWGFEFTDIKTIFATNQFDYFDIRDINLPTDENILTRDYCYTTEKGFYLNPYKPEPNPYPGVDPDTVEKIQADYREKLAKEA